MIHDMGNVQYFEMCETTMKVQCTYSFKYCAIGVVLHMWYVPIFLSKVTNPESKEIQPLIGSELHHQEESLSRCQTRQLGDTKNAPSR